MLAIRLEYKHVFEGEPTELASYLTQAPKSKYIDAITHLLSLVESPNLNYREFINSYFSSDNDFKNQLPDIIQKSFRASQPLSIINTENLYTILETALALPDEEIATAPTREEIHHFEIDLFKALLAVNQQTVTKEETINQWSEENDNEDKLPGMMLGNMLAYTDFTSFNYGFVSIVQLVKSIHFFKFMEVNYPIHLSSFLGKYRCGSWKDYIIKLTGIVFMLIKENKPGSSTIILQPDMENYEDIVFFMDQFSQETLDLPEEDYDFLLLRDKPLYKIRENEYRILSKVFLAEKIFKSLYFQFNSINSSFTAPDKVIEFKSKIGLDFSEKYLFYQVLKDSFPFKKVIHHSGDDFIKHGISAEPDYYIRYDNKIFLLESKDMLLKATVKTSYDVDLIQSEIKNNLLFNTTTSKPKAIKQLVGNISRILKKELIDQDYYTAKVRIYPIIVMHDRIYGVNGLNYFLNKWFLDELIELEKEGLDISRINPLVICDIDTLILLQESIKNRTVALNYLIDKYIESTKTSTDPFIHFDSFIGFAENFISKRKINPQMMIKTTSELFT